VSEPLSRLYDLALRALEEQERRADALRGRLGPTLAAAALGASLLSGPLVGGARPATFAGGLALVVAVGGLAVAVAAAGRMLAGRRGPTDALNALDLVEDLRRGDLLADEAAFYEAMITRLAERAESASEASDRLATTFTAILWGILVMLCGLGLAALVG
jgi:hypothetical protein